MKTKFRTFLIFLLVFLLSGALVAGVALADQLRIDGDGLEPVANNNLVIGDINAGSDTTKPVLLQIRRQGQETNPSQNVFADGARVTITSYEVTGSAAAWFEITGATLNLPLNWESSGDLSDVVTSSVKLTVPDTATPGDYSGTIRYQATGDKSTGGTNTITHNMGYTFTVPEPVTGPTTADITFAQTGIGDDFTDTVLTVDGEPYTEDELPVTLTFDVGEEVDFEYHSPLVVLADSKQYVWTGTTGLTTTRSGTFTVTADDDGETITGAYKTQYYLTVNTDYSTAGGAGWYDDGDEATATVDDSTVYDTDDPDGTRYVFNGWSGDATGNTTSSDPITMNGPKTATATWQTQYYLTVNSQYGTVGGAGWYNSGTTANATVTPLLAPGPHGTSHVFTSWSGDATGSTSPSSNITMDGPKTATANWEFRLGVANVKVPANAINKVVKNGSTIPIRWQYTDETGAIVDSSTANPRIFLSLTGDCPYEGEVDFVADGAGNSGLRYDAETQTWMFNFQTKGLKNGVYTLAISDGRGTPVEIEITLGK